MTTPSGPPGFPYLWQELQSPFCSTCSIYVPLKDTPAPWPKSCMVHAGQHGIPQEPGSVVTAKGSGSSFTRKTRITVLVAQGRKPVESWRERGSGWWHPGVSWRWHWVKMFQSPALVISVATVPTVKEKRLMSLLPTIPFNTCRALPKYKRKWKQKGKCRTWSCLTCEEIPPHRTAKRQHADLQPSQQKGHLKQPDLFTT